MFHFALFAHILTLSLSAHELRVSGGPTNYQYEGAGPSPNLLWELKPTYTSQPYMEVELKMNVHHNTYRRLEVEYLGGEFKDEVVQPIRHKVESWVSYFGWAWTREEGFGFEAGPVAVVQTHSLRSGSEQLTEQVTRIGSFFGASFIANWNDWKWQAFSSVGVLGLPQRQSAISELELTVDRPVGELWRAGLKAKMGLIQIDRENSKYRDFGGTSSATVLSRNGETDTKVLMFNITRKI